MERGGELQVRVWLVALGLLAIVSSVDYALGQLVADEAEVRISARRLNDGRTEFALQQRLNGQWGERILPRTRFLPAHRRSEGWANSSPVSISYARGDERIVRISARQLATDG